MPAIKLNTLEYWTKQYFRNGDITRAEYNRLMAEVRNEKARAAKELASADAKSKAQYPWLGALDEYSEGAFEDFLNQMRETF